MISYVDHISLHLSSLSNFVFSFQIRNPSPSGPLARERQIRQVTMAAAIIYVTSVVCYIPHYIANDVIEIRDDHFNVTFYAIKDNFSEDDNDMSGVSMSFLVFVNLIVYALAGKIVPCVLILVFTGTLLYNMAVKTRRRRRRLSLQRQHANTTRMLMVVLILFVVTELPQGVILLLSATVPGFFDGVFYNIADLTDFVSLLNNAVNFVLYCVMSQQFREKFVQMYVRPLCEKRRSVISSTTSELMTLRGGGGGGGVGGGGQAGGEEGGGGGSQLLHPGGASGRVTMTTTCNNTMIQDGDTHTDRL